MNINEFYMVVFSDKESSTDCRGSCVDGECPELRIALFAKGF